MDGLRPALDAPALLATDLAFLQICKLPEVVYRVKVANLHEPGTHAFHDLTSGLEAPTPMCLPLEQITWVQRVRAELKEAAELAGRGGRPEGEFLHQGRVFRLDQAAQLAVEGGVFGVLGDRVQGGMVALVTLVLPNVNY